MLSTVTLICMILGNKQMCLQMQALHCIFYSQQQNILTKMATHTESSSHPETLRAGGRSQMTEGILPDLLRD